MKIKIVNKKRTAILVVLAGMILFFAAFLYYQNFHNLEYRKQKCAEEASFKIKEFYKGTNFDPEEEVSEMFYMDCLRDSGWVK